MNEIPHKFRVGESVVFATSISKKKATVIARDRSYGLPTYQVKLEDNSIMTLCESDLSKPKTI